MTDTKKFQSRNNLKKGFAKIDNVLNNQAKNYKLEPAFYKYRIGKNWENILSGFLAEVEGRTKVLDLKKGILIIASLDKQLAYKIKVLAQRILYAINNFLGGQFVFAIQVVV